MKNKNFHSNNFGLKILIVQAWNFLILHEFLFSLEHEISTKHI